MGAMEGSAIAFMIFGWGVVFIMMAIGLSKVFKAGIYFEEKKEEKQ